MSELTAALGGRTVWNVNSTARGGGVAELLASLIPYERGAGVDERWVVIEGSPEFFDVTKRIHNLLHGVSSDGAGFSPAERATYERAMKRNASALADAVNAGDVVILHDPQSAGLVPALSALGAIVIWRSHVGVDEPNDFARAAWEFLRPYLDRASALVFSRRSYVWDRLDPSKVQIIAPCIDAFTAKNRELTDEEIGRLLAETGVPTGGRIVLQVSRWDRLKDPMGVLRAFADHIAPDTPDTCLVLAGPAATSVRDDPEQPEVLRELQAQLQALDASIASRVCIAQLPMEDQDENAAMVNALQRRADVVVQKSLAEGFGLTVAEAMWKSRPVVASHVGGISDQIEDGKSGVLVEPKDLEAFGHSVTGLVNDRDRAARMGAAARSRVRAVSCAASPQAAGAADHQLAVVAGGAARGQQSHSPGEVTWQSSWASRCGEHARRAAGRSRSTARRTSAASSARFATTARGGMRTSAPTAGASWCSGRGARRLELQHEDLGAGTGTSSSPPVRQSRSRINFSESGHLYSTRGLGMIVRNLVEMTGTERDVRGEGWRSRRLLRRDDGVKFSLHLHRARRRHRARARVRESFRGQLLHRGQWRGDRRGEREEPSA